LQCDPATVSRDVLIVFAAKYLFLVIPAIAFIYWLTAPSRTRKYLFFLGMAVGLISVIIGQAIAYFYFDPRPFVTGHFQPLIPHVADNGFPSDHTLLSAVIAATLTTVSVPMGIVLWVITAMVAIARVSAGLHHAIDVIGSICIAAVVTMIAQRRVRARLPQ